MRAPIAACGSRSRPLPRTPPQGRGAAGRSRPALRLPGSAGLGAAWRRWVGGRRAAVPPRAVDGRAAGRRVRAGAARCPAALPAAPSGDVVMRRPRARPHGRPAAAAPRRPDGAATRAAVRSRHRAGLRLPRRPQSHLQVTAGERRDRAAGTRGRRAERGRAARSAALAVRLPRFTVGRCEAPAGRVARGAVP